MNTTIEILEEMADSSPFGVEADAAYVKLKDVESISELASVDIPNAGIVLHNLLDTIQSIRSYDGRRLIEIISSIPAIPVQEDFI